MSFFQNRSELKNKLKHITYITISLLIFSSWFWAPLLRDILLYGFESHQQNYFSTMMLRYPLMHFFAFNIAGLLIIVGLVYIIRKYKSEKEVIKTLNKLKLLVNILPVDERIITLALASDFKDFEDAIQYYAAMENNLEIILTRNIKDYKKAKIIVITAEEYLKYRERY